MPREHVRQVCQVALSGTDMAADVDGFFEGVVRDVPAALDGVEDEDLETAEFVELAFGDVVGVGDVGEVAEAEAEDGQFVVHGPDWDDRNAVDGEGQAGNQVDVHFRRAGVGLFGEDVVIFFLQGFQYVGFAEDGERAFLEIVERAHVVETAGVVFMVVGQEDGIEVADVFAEHLLPEIRPGIDQECLSFILDQGRAPQPLVSRIFRRTHFALASDHRNALRSPSP